MGVEAAKKCWISDSELERECGDAAAVDRLREEARALVAYIAEHAGELRPAFLGQPAVAQLLGES